MNEIQTLMQVLNIVITATGLFFIYNQLRLSRSTASAEFYIKLRNDFEDRHTEIYSKLRSGGIFYDEVQRPFQALELQNIYACVSFFDNLQMLRNKGFISLKDINDMFGFRFFSIMHNPNVEAQIKNKKESFFLHVIVLYQDFYDYRKSTGQEIERDNNHKRYLIDD